MIKNSINSLMALRRPLKRAIGVIFDTAAFVSTGLLVQVLFTGEFDVSLLPPILAAASAVAVIAIGGGYSSVVRFMGPYTPGLLAVAALLASASLIASKFLMPPHQIMPSQESLLFCVLSFVLIYGVRVAWGQLTRISRVTVRSWQAVAVYGAGAAGRQLVSALRGDHAYDPVLFIDDNPELQGLRVLGLKIYPSDRLHELLGRFNVSQVFLAIPSATDEVRSAILDRLSAESIKVQIIPHIDRIIKGHVGPESLRSIEMEDILGRKAVPADPALLLSNIEGKSVLVTGAGGSIGSELCRSILRLRPRELILFEMSEPALFQIEQEMLTAIAQVEAGRGPRLVPVLGNVMDGQLLQKVFRTHQVDTVFHAAAYKHVPLVESNAVEGARNNILGTKSIVEAAVANKVGTFVLVSTDKAVRPTNVMGASKRVAEMIVQLAGERHESRMSIVRFGNVLGSSGSVLPSFKAQILRGGPITVTHPEVMRYFMTIPEAAQLVIQAGSIGTTGDVFHLDMGEPIRILALARRLLSLYGLKERTVEGGSGIEISITGLRPGEKLFEELLIDNSARPTSHPRIFGAQESHPGEAQLTKMLANFTAAFNDRNDAKVVSLLEEIVEGFVPDPRSLAAGEADAPAEAPQADKNVVKLRN